MQQNVDMGFRAPNEHVPWRICCWWYGTWLTASIKLCCYLYVGIRTVDSDNVPKLPKPFVMLFNRSHFNFAEYLLFVSENVWKRHGERERERERESGGISACYRQRKEYHHVVVWEGVVCVRERARPMFLEFESMCVCVIVILDSFSFLECDLLLFSDIYLVI